jgi:hypothetical protein
MRNRRVFQRTSCTIPVVVHAAGRFFYGELVDLSLGGSRMVGKTALPADRLELTPHRTHLDRASIIPLPYKVSWQEQEEDGRSSAGLMFAGGIDAFFRGWLADHLQEALPSQELLLDARQVVRIPCQLEGQLRRESGETLDCSILDLSVGGVSLATTAELLPGESFTLSLPDHPQLGSPEVIVLRTQPFTGHFLCGTKFLELNSSQVECLETLVPSLARATLEPEQPDEASA